MGYSRRVLRRAASGVPAITLAFAVLLSRVVAAQNVSPVVPGSAASVNTVAQLVEREYFDPSIAIRMAHALRTRASEGRYGHVETWEALARLLTADLFAMSQDKHLVVRPIGRSASGPPRSSEEERRSQARRTNYGVQRVEVLPGNVGYLNLTAFFRPEEARETLQSSMELLRSADALILDMRQNGGGSPDTVAWLLSYFFEEASMPLFDIVSRDGETRRYTTSSVPYRDGTSPIFVLTAQGTFSGGEGLAFILQEHRRATVIGERTAGAANPGRPYPAGEHLEVTVPNGQLRTAIRSGNWEGGGVTPDVVAPAADALRIAHIHALRELLKSVETSPWQERLRRELERLEGFRKR